MNFTHRLAIAFIFLACLLLQFACSSSRTSSELANAKPVVQTKTAIQLDITCGESPAPLVANAEQLEQSFSCKKLDSDMFKDPYYAWQCLLETCNYNGQIVPKGTYCNKTRCIIDWETPAEAERDCSGEECCGMAAGTGVCDGTVDQETWIIDLLSLAPSVEVCNNGNCPCGEGVCGKLTYCKDNQCICGDTEQDTDKGNALCVPYVGSTSSGGNYRECSTTPCDLNSDNCWQDGDEYCFYEDGPERHGAFYDDAYYK